MDQPLHVFLTELDLGDPKFAQKCLSWMGQTQREIAELFAKTEKTIAQSRTVIAEADQLLTQAAPGAVQGREGGTTRDSR
jgi:hypothetical protein